MIDKKTLLQWLREEGALYQDDNLYHAEKAFFANSVIQWCAGRKIAKNISDGELERYFHCLSLFLKNKLDLYWDNDIINVRVLNKEKSLEKKNESTSLET